MFETAPRTTIGTTQRRTGVVSEQPRRLVLALAILLVALLGLLIKDRQFWFGSEQATIESDLPEITNSAQGAAPARKTQSAATNSAKKQAHLTTSSETPSDNGAVAVTRTVLPPLDVEVVAGDKHQKVHPATNSKRVELQNPAENVGVATNAAEHEALPAPAVQPQPSIKASYPLLAQHMNVQGSVVLQALISAEGLVENLRVVSGPAILTTAAQQAVREWRFKPVVQNGRPVETEARITVNFSIKIADNSGSTTLAESRGSDVLIISR
jgi:TonB family protein